ncbi:SNX19 [Mytilus edulis]|uniref:SNX19 n=1 Tax=Mytilus edulis TaxID=6550 RepID=A0A8S3QSF5_MYTED|nr:SNX19 [Mytilus edulis]
MQLSDRSVATCTQVSWLEEVETIADLIQKHFVHSWLKDFDPHIDVLTEYDKVLRDGIINFAYKLKKVDPSDLVKEICLNGCHHLRTLQTSRDKYKIQPRRRLSSGRRDSGSLSSLNRRYASVEEAFENISTYHIGIYDENENSYLFSICDIILNKAFSGIFLNSQVLNYILSEILTCNVLLPVLDLLSEPDFIYEKMIFILSDEALDIPVDEEDFVEEVNETFQIGDNQYYHDSSDNTSKHLGLRNENPPDTIENQTASSINFSPISQNSATEINCDEKFVPVIPMALIEPAATFSVSDSGPPSPMETGSPVHRLNEMKASQPDFFLSCSDDDKPDMPDPYMNSLEIIETKPAIFLDVCIIDSEIRNESRSNSQFVLYVMQSLIQIDDICNGPELNEFLAYEGDGHIAFVRKTPENSMPRFDKMIVKTMSGVFDEIIKIPSRVNFPSLPGKKETNKEVEKNDCDLIAVDFDLNTKLVNIIKNQSLEEELQEYINSCDCPFFTSEDLPQNKLEETADQLSEEDISLAEAVVDIGVQTLQGKDNWVCRERVIIVMKRLIGVILDRWLRDQITDLTSEQMCVKYLQLLRRTVWPDGELFEGGRPVKTDRQKAATKEQARRCLAQFFPDTLRRLVGNEDFDHGINEIIESLQYKKLNRHLIYTLMDQLMDSVYSETRDRKSST